MKEIFKEYYTPSPEKFKEIWKSAHFVFDTNVLLNLYRYSKSTRNDWFNVLEELSRSERLFLPYQIGFEFHENYVSVIEESKNFLKEKNNELVSLKNKIEEIINNEKRLKEKKKEILGKYEEFSIYFQEVIKKEEPDFTKEDTIREKLIAIFENKTGIKPSEEQSKLLENKGEQRFKNKIPPGFEDNMKESNKYGDFFIWHQILEYSKSKKVSVIFVTNDSKKDWWLKGKNKNLIQPSPLLLKEFNQSTEKDYYQYQPESFILNTKEYLNSKITKETIAETLSIAEEVKEKENLTEDLRRSMGFEKINADLVNEILDEERKRRSLSKTLNLEIESSEKYRKYLREQLGWNVDNILETQRNLMANPYKMSDEDIESVYKKYIKKNKKNDPNKGK